MQTAADINGHDIGDSLNKRNYRQAKRQKEEARKTRQVDKQQRRSQRETSTVVTPAVDSVAEDTEPAATPLVSESK